jgi:cysteinyl-tRNA synthetase
MHNGMLRLTGEKMSKSLGNIATLQEVLDEWGRETLLLFFLTAHWRKPIDFSEETMAAAAAQAETFRNAQRVASSRAAEHSWNDFVAVLDDDFDTPAALAILHAWRDAGKVDELFQGLDVFGLEPERLPEERRDVTISPPAAGARAAAVSVSIRIVGAAPQEVRDLADRRHLARMDRDYVEADALRQKIQALGWEVQDDPDGYRLLPL